MNGRHWSRCIKKKLKKRETKGIKKRIKYKSRGPNRKWTFLKMSKNENPKIVLKKDYTLLLRDHIRHIFDSSMKQSVTIKKYAFLSSFLCEANGG